MRVYVAGPYSANNVIEILENIRKGQRASVEILLGGHEPFCPWLDYQFQFVLREGENLTVKDYYRYSIAWLEVSHCMVVLDGWSSSEGTRAEMKRAKELNITIYHGTEAFLKRDMKWDTNPIVGDIFKPKDEVYGPLKKRGPG
jgi:hypothetical protein